MEARQILYPAALKVGDYILLWPSTNPEISVVREFCTINSMCYVTLANIFTGDPYMEIPLQDMVQKEQYMLIVQKEPK